MERWALVVRGDKPGPDILVQHKGLVYIVTNMADCTIDYLRRYMNEDNLVVPADWQAHIFSMGPNESAPATILERGMSALPEGMVGGKFRILQGEMLIVTDEYVLTPSDMIVEFMPPPGKEPGV